MKKRADGRYQVNICVGKDENGKRKFKTVYGKTKKEVEEKEFAVKQMIAEGALAAENTYLKTWAKRWLDVYQKYKGYSVKHMYTNAVNVHIIPNIGNLKIAEINGTVVGELINSYVDKGMERTAEVIKIVMNSMMRQAYDDGIASRLITCRVKIPRKKEERKVLTKAQQLAIKNADLNEKQRLFVDLLLYTGIRRGEALALSLSDIDLEHETLSITKSLLYEKNDPVIKSPKSKAGYRNIPIPKTLLYGLRSYMATHTGTILLPMRNGGYMTQSSFTKFWKSIEKKIQESADRMNKELKEKQPWVTVEDMVEVDFTPHTFRHTYATSLYYAGVEAKAAQYLLGHSTVQITLDVYTHLDKKQVCDMERNRLTDYFNKNAI